METHIKALVEQGRRKKLKELMASWKTRRPYVDIWMVVDAEGRVIARNNNESSGDKVSFGGLIEKALEGEVELSTEIISPDEMRAATMIN